MMDSGYGASTELRSSITALGLTYVAGILSTTTVWTSGEEPFATKAMVGARTTDETDAPRRRAPAEVGQGASAQAARERLAHHRTARHTDLTRPVHLLQSYFCLGIESDLIRHAGLAPARVEEGPPKAADGFGAGFCTGSDVKPTARPIGIDVKSARGYDTIAFSGRLSSI